LGETISFSFYLASYLRLQKTELEFVCVELDKSYGPPSRKLLLFSGLEKKQLRGPKMLPNHSAKSPLSRKKYSRIISARFKSQSDPHFPENICHVSKIRLYFGR